MTLTLSDIQLDALKELANIGSAKAAGALSTLLAREVDISVARARVLSLADAVATCGDPETEMTSVAIRVAGDLAGEVLMLVPAAEARELCALLGAEPGTEIGESALREIGNILGTSYLGGLAAMTGLELLPSPPVLVTDMLGALVSSLVVIVAGVEDLVLLLDSELRVAEEECPMSFMLLPTAGTVAGLLAPLGLDS
ncbi:MAG: chemotaxis protein CheC [Solirubrobacteraceae bacterium]